MRWAKLCCLRGNESQLEMQLAFPTDTFKSVKYQLTLTLLISSNLYKCNMVSLVASNLLPGDIRCENFNCKIMFHEKVSLLALGNFTLNDAGKWRD